MEQRINLKPPHKIELKYSEISGLFGIVVLHWVEHEFRLYYARDLIEKLVKVKKEIIQTGLN